MVTFNFGAMGEALSKALVTGLSPTHLSVTLLGLGAMVVGYLSFKTYLSHRSREKEGVVAVRQCMAMSRQETKRLDLLLNALWVSGRAADHAMQPLSVFPAGGRVGAPADGARARASSASSQGGGCAGKLRTMTLCADIVFVGHVSRAHVSAHFTRPSQYELGGTPAIAGAVSGWPPARPDDPWDERYSRVDSMVGGILGGESRKGGEMRTRWRD